MICLEDAFDACVTQTHVVLDFLVLYHKKVALKGGCAGKYGRQTANELLQQRVSIADSVPIIMVCGALVKSVNVALQFRLTAVRITQDLVMAPDIINLLDVEGVVETLPVALQIDT